MGTTLRLLLDTNAFYLGFYSSRNLSPQTAELIRSSEGVFVSLVSFWEIALKVKIGKMNADALLSGGPRLLADLGFDLMRIEYRHIRETLQLPLHHRDPFDRLLIAQAQMEKLTIVSNDTMIDRYGVPRLW